MATEADGVKHLLALLAVDLQNATGDGSAATEKSNQARLTLSVLRRDLADARAHAYQELGHLQEAQAKAQLVFNETLSVEASNILAQLDVARERVNLFANRLSNRINEMDKFFNLLTHWIETEMSASGGNVRVAAEELTALYNRY
jgi:hypothetical protein